VPIRAPLPRVLLWTGLLCGGVLAVAGGLALRGPELVGVGVAAVLAACTAAGIAREKPGGHRRSMMEAAATAGAATVAALLVLAGVAALAGSAVAVLTLMVAVLGTLAVRVALSHRAGRLVASPGAARLGVLPSAAGPPIAVLPTAELGQEWLRTTAALAGPLEPAARASIVLRRQETLDELECRDRVGFGRWLATGPAAGSDPAVFVRGGPEPGRRLQGDPAADTDAA
jgi:hypothetical protein